MAFAMDTLGYAKRLRESGIPPEQAEAHAEAARDYVMLELVTKVDLATAVTSLREEMAGMRRDSRAAMDNLGLRLTIRLGTMVGAMIGVAVAVLAAIIKL